MPQARAGSTDTSSAAQGRFTVQLPSELAPVLDELGKRMSREVEKHAGFAPDFSRAQVVQSLANAAKNRRNGETPPPDGGDGGDGGDTGTGTTDAGAASAKA